MISVFHATGTVVPMLQRRYPDDYSVEELKPSITTRFVPTRRAPDLTLQQHSDATFNIKPKEPLSLGNVTRLEMRLLDAGTHEVVASVELGLGLVAKDDAWQANFEPQQMSMSGVMLKQLYIATDTRKYLLPMGHVNVVSTGV